MYGLTRGTMTLAGAAAAGFLLWFASQLETDVTGEYWAAVGLVAAAGLMMAVSQLLGGWTKWGWPRVSAAVFFLAFLPVLVAGGLVLLHAQPDSDSFGAGWAGDLGVDGLADDLAALWPAIAFAVGLVFGLSFDTTGPGVRELTLEELEARRRRGYVGPVPVDAREDEERDVVDREEGRPLVVERDEDEERVGERTRRDAG
jgi:hypothetical protein